MLCNIWGMREGQSKLVMGNLLGMRERAVYVSDEQLSGHEGKGSLG